ncbi:nickel-binding protein [Tenggerimyces flavus]|uniref:Nickel-binding protein n=1 Tax=Tenggerimyces flavus TaxID=1708749 RepID=A0ABV7Y815_9ACTN|nr:nickel-binding protein [Tenggerimyces flavus]MBM7788255.1 hypothetical protein [Tenggerimyces flavus]
MDVYLVERYATGLTPASLRAAGSRVAAACSGTYLGSVLVRGDEGALCLFRAPSLTAVEQAARQEGTLYERVVAVELVGFA